MNTDTSLAPSAVLARYPGHVGLSLVIGEARRHEQEIRQAIDVAKRRSADSFALARDKGNNQALGSARDGAGKMKETRGGRAARQHEGAQGLKLCIERIDLPLQPLNLGIPHLQATARVLALVGVTEIGAEIEKVVLDAREHGIERGMAAPRMEPRQADCGIGLIERAVGLDAEIVFRHAPP